MKKWFCFLGAFVCFLFCRISVKADLIWEPEDSFYRENASECTYVNRRFTANGPDGIVILYKSPESPKVVTTWENGYDVYISFTYEDNSGVVWGIYDGEPGETGWMPMEYMEVVYDYISFREDYGAEIADQNGTLEETYREESVCFWGYPGAGEPDCLFPMTMPDMPKYSGVYVDEKGHDWGYVGYYYGLRNVWICLDQPLADYGQLYPDGGPRIGTRDENADTESRDAEQRDLEQQETERIVPVPDHRTVVVVAVLVGSVVLVTAVLLVILRKGRS